MKKLMIIATLLLSLIITTSSPIYLSAQNTSEKIQVYFSPNGGATEAILKELRSAKKTILIQAYEITSIKIINEILEAHTRGVKIELLLDHTKSLAKESKAIFLLPKGITILTDKRHHSSHNKTMILDDETIITGSYNFTKQAEKNAENIIIIHDPKIAEIYTKNFKLHATHSKPFDPNNK
jgi:phosphatidylserine/phosphatidylglycerophosphate/cardiolipin synthase-like enzyme